MIRYLLLLLFIVFFALPAKSQEQKKGPDPAGAMELRANTRDKMIMSRGNMHQKMSRQRKQEMMKNNQIQMQRRMQMQQHRRVVRHQQMQQRSQQRQAVLRKKRQGGR
jgi:hypothetical protein